MNNEIEKLLNEIEESFMFVHDSLRGDEIDLSSEYKKINHTYFCMFCSHFESLFILVKSGHHSSGILLLRTMLELYVKSYYMEFIAKNKGDKVSDFINDTKKFPVFFKMVEQLENFKNDVGEGVNGTFSQFTKRNLASYEKFSLFSHGKGEYLKAFYEHGKISYTTEQISDILLTAKGLFETLSMLLCVVQNKQILLGELLEKYKSV